MDILDFCHYQRNFNSPCPFSNSTCRCCPWSDWYRNVWRSRDMFAFACNKIVTHSRFIKVILG